MPTDYWEMPDYARRNMIEVAREFRKAPTRGEGMLWHALRNRQLAGRKFRRQQQFGPFVVDFFCPSERLVVDVDGPIHDSQQAADAERQRLLETLGLRFVRIPTALVETDLPAALAEIQRALRPLH